MTDLTKAQIVFVFRPEACAIYNHPVEPFEGCELLAVVTEGQDVGRLIEQHQSEHPRWKFHIESVAAAMLV